MTIYPNPGNGAFVLDGKGLNGTVNMYVVEGRGKIVQTFEGEAQNGKFEKNIDLRHLPDGLYYLKLQSQDGSLIKKLIKQL